MLQPFVSVYVLSMPNAVKIPKQQYMHKSIVEYNLLTPFQEVHYRTSWLVLWGARLEDKRVYSFACFVCRVVLIAKFLLLKSNT